MVFGLIRKDDSNFQTLDESCAFSCFEANEASDNLIPSSNQQELSGLAYFTSKNLLTTIDASDNLDEDSDSNLLGDLMPYLNSTKNLVRAPSMDKEEHEESESATRTVLRAPSMDRTNSFVKYENGEGSESSESLDDLDINKTMEIMQLELPGIATVSTTGVQNTNSLDSLLKCEDKETKNSSRTDASIAFTACFDLAPEEALTKSDPIMLTMGSASIDLNELVSREIVDKETIQKIRQYVIQKLGNLHTSEVAIKETPVDETTRRKGRRRDSLIKPAGSSLLTDSDVTNAHDVKSSSHTNNDDRQSEPMQRRRSNYSSPDRKKIQDEKRNSKEVETKKTAASNESVPTSTRRSNPERRSPNKGANNGSKCSTTDAGQSKRSNDSSPNKVKSRPTSSSNTVESQKRPDHTSTLVFNDDMSTNRIKLRRSNSMNSVESFRHADVTNYRLSNENARSSVRNSNLPALTPHTTDCMNEFEGHILNDVSSPITSKKQISLFGTTGNKMIKFLSNRYLNQEKERPGLVKAESQAIIGSTHGLDNVLQNVKDPASADEFSEFKGHLVDGTVPFTPRSQKRFLNWRAIGLKKSLTIGSSSRYLIEGELDEVETETHIEIQCNDTSNISRPGVELTVQNKTNLVSMDSESKEALDVVHKVAGEAGTRKKPSKMHRERINHVSLNSEQNFQKEVQDIGQTNENDQQSQSPAKSSRSTSKTPPRRSIVRTSTPESHFNITNDIERDVIDSSDHSLPKHINSDSNSATECKISRNNIMPDNVTDAHTITHSHDNSKSPSRRRSSISRGLSQSVHVHTSPAKKGGKGSSTAVSRRQRLLASTTLDDGPSSSLSNDNYTFSQDVSKQLSEPIIDNERKSRQLSPDLILNPISGVVVGESRPPKNLSRSLHISSPTKKMGHNTEITVDVNLDLLYKSKMPSKGSTATDTGQGIDSTETKPAVSSRARKTTCKEFKKEFATETVSDEPIVNENVGRRRRNSLGMPIKAYNKA